MALTREKSVNKVADVLVRHQVPIKGGADVILEGAMVHATAAGYAVKVGDSSGEGIGPVLGVAEYTADNSTGTDGALSVWVQFGPFWRKLSSTSPPNESHARGSTVYAEDDETISIDSSLPVAGTLWRVEPTGVEDERGAYVLIAPDSGVLSALKSASVPLPLAAFYETDGTPLAAFADGVSTTPGLSLNDSECAGIRWNNDAAPDPIVTSMPIPSDLDTTRVCYLIFTAAKVGATPADVPKLGVEVFEHPVGALYDAGADLGGDTNAMADEPTKEVQALALAIAADSFSDPSAANNTMTITITPEAGKLGTDDLVLISARLAYTPII